MTIPIVPIVLTYEAIVLAVTPDLKGKTVLSPGFDTLPMVFEIGMS